MSSFRTFILFLLPLVLASCDFKKEKNTAPKPPPAPVSKPIVIKPKETKVEKEPVIVEPKVLEWEGGDFSVNNSFSDADIILVMLYADWCDHCKAFSPLLEGMTRREDKKIRVLRVDADLFPEIAQKFEVEAVPKTLIFRKGSLVGEFVGSISEEKLDTIIRNVSGETAIQAGS